jgi:hypothetical protein
MHWVLQPALWCRTPSAADRSRLHYLYHLKGGDGQATVASYHQGPHGEKILPETERYVGEIRDDQADFAGGG